MENIGVYLIQSKVSQMVYVGGSINLADRWEQHKQDLRLGTHHCFRLLGMYVMCPDLTFTVVETCTEFELKQAENKWMDKYREVLLNTIHSSSFSSFDNPEKLKQRFLAKADRHAKRKIAEEAKEIKKQQRFLDFKNLYEKEYDQPTQYRDLITVVNGKKINDGLTLSMSGFSTGDGDSFSKLRRNLANYFINITKSPSKLNLITSFDPFLSTSSGEMVDIRALAERSPYRTVGKLPKDMCVDSIEYKKRQCWTSLNLTDKSLFDDRTAIAYLADIYPPKSIATELYAATGLKVNQDRYALNMLLQFLFCTALQHNQPITVYVPSMRMRHLLLTWLGYTPQELF